MKAWEAEKDPLERQALEDEKRMEWKLAVMREKKRRIDKAAEAAEALEEVKNIEAQLAAQPDLPNQMRVIARSVACLARVQADQYDFSRSQDIAVRSIRLGFRDFARELVGAVGVEVGHRLDKTERFSAGAIEGVKAAAPKEEEARPPRREPVKVKFPDSYSGKREENFDNWEANVKTYMHLQQVSLDQQVLIAIHALRDEAASFARSLVRAANCSDDPVAYSSFTSLTEFLKLLRERFADVARSVKASDKLQTIHSRKWKSVGALKGTMDELVAIPDHGVIEGQLVNLFYRAMPEAFRGQFFTKSEDPATTYDSLSHEVVAFEAKSVSLSIFWHKDLDRGKQWKGRTISGQVKTKDSLVMTFDEGSVDEIPYDQIEWGLEEADNGVGQGRSYAVVAAGGRPQGGRGQGQGGRALGSRPVEFMSARMPSEKVATSTYERELYALRQALDHWKHYLLGRHFKVYSDHETLRWLKTQAKMTPKLTRWAAEIDQYDFELKPVTGKYNVVADALSRRADYFGAIVHYLDIGKDLRQQVREAYAQDPIYGELLKKVKEAPETEPNYRTTEGLLFEKTNVFDRLCIPNSEKIRSLILGECHDTEGHFGWQKTLANLMRAYTWPGMKNDSVEYVRSCKYVVVAVDLHTKISWDDLKAAWHKRFQIEPPKIKATDKLMTFEQSTLPSVDWIDEYQRVTSVSDIQMGFKVVKHYFISTSCPALGNALTRAEDTLTTTAELFDKAARIIVTNKEAKNLHRSSATGPRRDQHRPKVVVVAAIMPNDQTSEAVSDNEGDRLAAARDGGRPGKG
ncbi:hypothetical protein CBR_g37780 [Chara braunii]|uniref:Reverse transcriptase RNase H-like domain-containing protein n=1 Tax=Chara braunii TaxID=69332 RepID=A0A388LNR9_CHABU|nr:hypothetical protein CBR_g37780 [Chara braunii]|eukprot:GBG83909.1 hypothetical protein CBR_g37780 [Chara braunii]